jgi:NADH-quinone oxidoreductase subunit F
MYWDPHLLIEGMIIAAHALKAVHNYIYIRGEMMREYLVLERAVREAYQKGYLGQNVMGSSVRCEITVHRGAGAYICGEETRSSTRSRASAAGRGSSRRSRRSRACSASRTIVNNVETLMNVPFIVEKGRASVRRPRGGRSGGTRIVCVSATSTGRRLRAADEPSTFNQLINDVCGGCGRSARSRGSSGRLLDAAARRQRD